MHTRDRVKSLIKRLTQQAEHGIAGADRIPDWVSALRASQRRRLTRRFSAAQPELPALAEQQLPDRLHSLSNREASHLTASNPMTFDLRKKREHAIRLSGDGKNTLETRVAHPQTCNTSHPQRYAAKAHPTEVEAAIESAAMQIFECDAEACSLGHRGWKSSSEPDQ